jgi:hypothetical protein
VTQCVPGGALFACSAVEMILAALGSADVFSRPARVAAGVFPLLILFIPVLSYPCGNPPIYPSMRGLIWCVMCREAATPTRLEILFISAAYA